MFNGAGRNERTARLVAAATVGVVGVVIAASAVVPTQALDAASPPPMAEWTTPLSPTADPNVLVPYAPSDVIEFDGVLFVADPAGVDRFDAATGSVLASFPAPADVTIADIVANATGSIYAVGTLADNGDPQIWVGRYTPAGVLDWSDSYGNPYSIEPLPFGLGDDRGRAVALDGSGALYVGGLLDANGGFLAQLSVRKYLEPSVTTGSFVPTAQWTEEYLADEVPTIQDMAATSSGVYIAVFNPCMQCVFGLLRISPMGDQFAFATNIRPIGVAATAAGVYVTETVLNGFGTLDARVLKLDPVTLAVIWSEDIGRPGSFDPATDQVDFGSNDTTSDIVVEGTTVYVTGTTCDQENTDNGACTPVPNTPIPGLAASDGFLLQLQDNGLTATVELLASTPPGGGLGTDGTALYLTGSDGGGVGDCSLRTFERSAGSCFLAKIIDSPAGPAVWPDFDGDGSADRSVFRPAVGGWYVDGQATTFLGLAGDTPVPGDYNGDGTTERAVFRGGAWFIQGQPTTFLGTATDVPVPGDYDGDGDWEPAVYRNGTWFIDSQTTRFLGAAGDMPVPGDYNGDGTTEIAVYRPAVGGWYVDGAAPVFYGLSSDVPVPADYNGDGTTERAVYRPAVGGWYVDGQTTQFIGLSIDVPVPADYNGDGTTERAVYRPAFGGWYVQGATTVFHGLGTDTPLPLPAAVYNAYYGATADP